MTVSYHKLLMIPALVLILVVLVISSKSSAQVAADDEDQLVTRNSPADFEMQREFDENRERWRVPNEQAQSILEHYRSQLEKIPGAENVTYGLDTDTDKMYILVQTADEPTEETLDAAPKELDGLEVRVEQVPVGVAAVGVWYLPSKPSNL